MRKRGRPQKNPDQRRDSHIIVRIGHSEREEIEHAAECAGLRLSDCIRVSATKGERRRALLANSAVVKCDGAVEVGH